MAPWCHPRLPPEVTDKTFSSKRPDIKYIGELAFVTGIQLVIKEKEAALGITAEEWGRARDVL
jgi:hypothetical protein